SPPIVIIPFGHPTGKIDVKGGCRPRSWSRWAQTVPVLTEIPRLIRAASVFCRTNLHYFALSLARNTLLQPLAPVTEKRVIMPFGRAPSVSEPGEHTTPVIALRCLPRFEKLCDSPHPFRVHVSH